MTTPHAARREFLRVASRSLGALVVSHQLAGCSGDGGADDGTGGDGTDGGTGDGGATGGDPTDGGSTGGGSTDAGATDGDPTDGNATDGTDDAIFAHGIASGDPGPDRAILWTRVTPPDAREVTVRWEVATDPDFATLTHAGETVTEAARDWTVKVDVRDLAPGTEHFYRFATGRTLSGTGRVRTLPVGATAAVRLAVVSCSNYPAGYFHVYAEIGARDDIDAVVHLGDYIYEDGAGGFATEDAEALGRTLAPGNDTEATRLADYRRRYATYREDADLQAAHASATFIAVWDDHEIANNVWRDGADNHDPSEGVFETRRAEAIRAWFEWMPVRPPGADPQGTDGEIYREFEFGDLLSLNMLDARQAGRDRAVDRNDYIDPASRTLDAAGLDAALGDPNRRLLGDAQSQWLDGRLAGSGTRWQVLGQQVPMARMRVPAEMRIDPERRGSVANLAELAAIGTRLAADDPTVDAAERARFETRLPYYQDGWDGYPAERERLLETARRYASNLVVLAGDTHNAWASELRTADGTPVGVELATTAVSSPGLSRLFGVANAAEAVDVESALETIIDDVVYVNVLERGYLTVTFTPDEARAEWTFVSTVKSRDYTLSERARRLAVRPGAGQRRLVEPLP